MLDTVFKFEKETKTTLQFKEDAKNYNPVIGTLYVKKHALKMLGYEKGDTLCVTLEKGEIA